MTGLFLQQVNGLKSKINTEEDIKDLQKISETTAKYNTGPHADLGLNNPDVKTNRDRQKQDMFKATGKINE